MDSRRRGATLLLAALVLGRLLDRFDLPFERREPETRPRAAADSIRSSAPDGGPPGDRARDGPLGDRPDGMPGDPSRDGPPGDPRRGAPGPDAPPSAPSNTAPVPGDAPVRVNRASATELQRLPGVGPVLAARIVDERASRGPFRSAAELRRVKGIGPKTCARLAPHLRFD